MNKILRWMRWELFSNLELYVDSSNCPNFTALGEAYAAEFDLPEEIPDEVWDAAADAFTPYMAELNE